VSQPAPTERRPTGGRPRRRKRATGATFATAAAASVIGAVLVVVLLVQLAHNNKIKSQLGSSVYVAARTTILMREIDTPGPDGRSGPVLFQALLGSKDIYIQHQGTDSEKGWLAFDAHAPGAARTCVLQWVMAQHEFKDPCDSRTFPADGTGLPHYSTTVNSSHRVVVDLNAAVPFP
jgi:hypothetical protein